MATINTSAIISQASGGLDPNADSVRQQTSTALTADSMRLSCASSNVLVVNTLVDELNSNDHRLSLREAINIANSTPSNTDIFLRPGTYTISISGANEEVNQSGDFDILGSGRLKIYSVGRGATINANGLDRIFDVKSGASLTLGNLGITGGIADFGGGIVNYGHLTLNGSSSIYGNTVNGSGNSAIFNGGGIYNTGIVTLRDSSAVHNNVAYEIGGGIFNIGTVTLQGHSSIYGNTGGVGGGITNSGGTLTLQSYSSIHDNTSNSSGGGIFNNGGTTTLQGHSSIYGNAARNNVGGGIYSTGGSVTLNGYSSIYGNTASYAGGGIFSYAASSPLSNVTLNDYSSIYANTAGSLGGGVLNGDRNVLTLNDSSSVYNNSPDNIA